MSFGYRRPPQNRRKTHPTVESLKTTYKTLSLYHTDIPNLHKHTGPVSLGYILQSDWQEKQQINLSECTPALQAAEASDRRSTGTTTGRHEKRLMVSREATRARRSMYTVCVRQNVQWNIAQRTALVEGGRAGRQSSSDIGRHQACQPSSRDAAKHRGAAHSQQKDGPQSRSASSQKAVIAPLAVIASSRVTTAPREEGTPCMAHVSSLCNGGTGTTPQPPPYQHNTTDPTTDSNETIMTVQHNKMPYEYATAQCWVVH